MTGVATTPVLIAEKRISRTIVRVQDDVTVPAEIESNSKLNGVSYHPASSGVTAIYSADSDVNRQVDAIEADSERFRTFASAVMAKHQPVRNYGSGMTVCTCGSPVVLCDYTMLANEYLSSPTTVRKVVD